MTFWPKLISIIILVFLVSTSFEQNCSNWAKINQQTSGVQIGDLDVSGDIITIEALINRTEPIDETFDGGDVVSKHDNPGDANYLLRPELAQITTSNGFFATKKTCPIQLNKTYHIAMVYDGKKLKFYRNGFLMSEVSASGNLYQNNWLTKIGTTANVSSPYPADFLGYINEVRIWKVARSQSDIRKYMNQSLPNPSTQNGLLAYYTFDDLKNKQGNTQWDGNVVGSVSINQTVSNCQLIEDSCEVKPSNVTASFTGPDSICVTTPAKFTNTSQNASNYLWSFCSDFKTTPTVNNIGNPGDLLNEPVFMDYGLDDNGNYYGFVTNHLVGRIIRLNFGKSLLNAPTAEDLGDFGGVVPQQVEGIKLEHLNGKWYAIAVGGGNDNQSPNSSPRIIKLDFGNSLANTPVATNWGNLGELDLPLDLQIINEGGLFYGFTMSVYSNKITRFDFGSDFTNPPTPVELNNIGNLDYPDGFTFVKNNNNWYAFVANAYSNNIVRLDFGSSITNTPVPTTIYNPGGLLNGPRDINFLTTCNGINAYVLNGNDNKLIRLNFGSDIINTSPTGYDLGSFDFSVPHSFSNFFVEGSDIYAFVPNANGNNIDRLKFAGCSSVPGSTKQNPDSVKYPASGNYTVNLMVDVGLPTQTSFCKQIVVKNCIPPVTASFTAPDTICKNASVTIKNTSVGATNYLWSFCNDFTNDPTSKSLGNPGNNLGRPVFSDYGLDDNGNYYSIVTNHVPGKITRLNFGNSLLNTPTSEDLGDVNGVVPNQVEGVQVLRVNGRWYAIAVGGGNEYTNSTPRIIKLDFGNSLANKPVATNWGNIGSLDLPIDFSILQENGNYYGFTMNVNSNTITRFDFGTDFINPPKGTNLGNIGSLDYPDGFTFVKSVDTWYAFAVNTYSNAITRLNFGNSLTNKPTAYVIANPNGLLSKPRDITILSTCNGFIGYIVNANDNNTIKLNFGADITATPTATSLGNIGNYVFPHSFSKFFTNGNNIYAFVPTVDNNSLNRIEIEGCQDIPGSTKKNPDPVVYDSSGIYTISLMVDLGLPTQTSYCKQILVKDCECSLKAAFTYSRIACDPTVIQFTNTTKNADSIRWDFGNGQTDTSQNPIIKYAAYGNYVVHLYAKTKSGCTDTLTQTINVSTQQANVILTKDTAICIGDSIKLNAVNGLQYCWSPSKGLSDSTIQNPVAKPIITTTYYLNVLTQSNSLISRDSVTIIVHSLPTVSAGADIIFCKTATPLQLLATGASTYTWQPSSGLSDSLIANPFTSPDTTTKYYVTGIDGNGCANIDSMIVSVLPAPAFSISPDTSFICSGYFLTIDAKGGNIYSWSPSQTIVNASDSSAKVFPTTATTYQVIIQNTVCRLSDTLTSYVGTEPTPKVSISKSNDIDCINLQAQLNVISEGISFKWTPTTNISDTTISNPIVNPPTDTWYAVRVLAENGCATKDSIFVKSTPTGNINLLVPSAFTPNHDGLNDCFGVHYWGAADYFDMAIYDKWGYLVYHTNNIGSCWDGTIRGKPQGAGTYVYKINMQSNCTNGVRIHKAGTVVLIR